MPFENEPCSKPWEEYDVDLGPSSTADSVEERATPTPTPTSVS